MNNPRPSISRIEPISLGEMNPELAETMASSLTLNGRPLNIFGVLGHHPKLFKRFNQMGGFLLNKGLIPAREREIVILRVGWNAQSEYEFGQHTLIGARCGLTQGEIAALTRPASEYSWSRDDRVLIALADDLANDDFATDATWAPLRERWSEAQLVELLILIGYYRLVAGFLNSVGVQLDEGVPGFPVI